MSEPGCTCIAHDQTKQSTGTSANEPDVSDDSVTSQPSHTFCNLSFVSSPKASDASCEAAKDKAKRVRPDSHECASCTRGAHTRGLLNEHASCTNLYLHIFVSSTMHNNGKPTQAACMLFPATLHMALWDSPRTEIWSHLIASLACRVTGMLCQSKSSTPCAYLPKRASQSLEQPVVRDWQWSSPFLGRADGFWYKSKI